MASSESAVERPVWRQGRGWQPAAAAERASVRWRVRPADHPGTGGLAGQRLLYRRCQPARRGAALRKIRWNNGGGTTLAPAVDPRIPHTTPCDTRTPVL